MAEDDLPGPEDDIDLPSGPVLVYEAFIRWFFIPRAFCPFSWAETVPYNEASLILAAGDDGMLFVQYVDRSFRVSSLCPPNSTPRTKYPGLVSFSPVSYKR